MIFMRRAIFAILLAACAPSALQAAPTPTAELMKPPANAAHFVVVSEAGKHGDEWRWTLPDGSVAYRESILLRGLVYEQDEVVHFGPGGTPDKITIRGVTPSGDAAESFAIDKAIAHWKSPVDAGEAPYEPTAFYIPSGGAFLANEAAIGPLLAAGAKGLVLLPSGKGTIEPSRGLTVTGPDGPKTVSLYFIKGINQTPQPVWLNADKTLFGFSVGLAVVPAGYEGNLKALDAAQIEAIATMAPTIAKRFLTTDARRPVLFRNVRLYDADQKRFLEGQNVLTEDGKIVRVGPGEGGRVPAGTRVIEGAGKTLVPGLWDSHMHVSDDFNALSELALGVTSFRNPGGPIELAVSQRTRRAEGTLLAPEAFTSVIVDGKGPLAAQGSITVSSEAETIAAVRKIKAAGLTGVKFYTSMNPAWIPPAAAEAKKLGLHVHGHIPAGMRTLDAINAGYDEITHIYFGTMQAMPDEVVAKSNGLMRLLGPGKYFKDVDFNAEPTKTVIATMAKRGIVLDPTLVVVELVLMARAGTVGAAYVPFIGTLPAATERSFKSGPLPLPEGTTSDDTAKSFHHMVEYVPVLYKAGVPIVAGTDGNGTELVRELELYVEGGMTPAAALSTATIAAAHNVGADKRTGSIAVGKEADLVLVDGDPSRKIGDLRHVSAVMTDGALLDGDALREAAGFSGKPK